jgi:hypothetical protein
MPDWAFYWHSGILASMHVHCPDPCCMTKATLRVHVHASCPCPCCMSVSMLLVHANAVCSCQFPCTYLKKCRTVQHLVNLVPDWKKLMTKLTQSGIFLVWYWTKIWDAGMPMPALVSSMPMPSYVVRYPQYRLLGLAMKSLLSHLPSSLL